ncbi:MAG: nuclear pore complex subunit [Bacteroidetes bacterium 4572_117]|nr:MAG: nuclear pore complex subunit [Bacteroidetes bacterium 4572_117]
MENLSLQGSPKTPTVKMDTEKGVIEIKGRSIPENSIDFYRPIVEWLDGYAQSPAEITEVNIQLEYFNTSSSKCILDVFKKLETVYKKNGEKGVSINWFYEEDDEDMLEAGEDYQSILKIPFKMVELEE